METCQIVLLFLKKGYVIDGCNDDCVCAGGGE